MEQDQISVPVGPKFRRRIQDRVTHDALFDEAVARGEVTGEIGGPEYSVWRLKQRLARKGPPKRGEKAHDDGQVYFLQAGESGPIKIGTTTNLRRRLNKLQQGHPEKLIVRALRKGGRKTEVRYHDKFAAFAIRGEWFEPAPAILSEIERIKGGQ